LDSSPTQQKKIFFTWTRTNFTEGYEFELSVDEGFGTVLFKKSVTDNFLAMVNPPAGEYFWRVRAFSQTHSSRFSDSRNFIVEP